KLLPADALGVSWTMLRSSASGGAEREIQEFVTKTKNAELVATGSAPDGFADPKSWLPQFSEAYRKHAGSRNPGQPGATQLSDLPLIEINAKNDKTDAFVLLVSGDGGWAGIDRDLGTFLSEDGLPVVGFDSLRYFWAKKTPEQTAKDLSLAIEHY